MNMFFLISCLFFFQGVLSKSSIHSFMDETYKGVSGFGIPSSEVDCINKSGSSSTYGEIKYDGLSTLLKDLSLTSNDIFYDLGSGNGKVIVQVVKETPVKKAVGIELSTPRHQQAQKIKNSLNEKLKKKIEFKEGDIVKQSIKDATIIYMCSTCYPDALMEKLRDKFLKLKPGTIVLSLKSLPSHDRLILEKTYTLPMTWSSNSSVYRYKVKKK